MLVVHGFQGAQFHVALAQRRICCLTCVLRIALRRSASSQAEQLRFVFLERLGEPQVIEVVFSERVVGSE